MIDAQEAQLRATRREFATMFMGDLLTRRGDGLEHATARRLVRATYAMSRELGEEPQDYALGLAFLAGVSALASWDPARSLASSQVWAWAGFHARRECKREARSARGSRPSGLMLSAESKHGEPHEIVADGDLRVAMHRVICETLHGRERFILVARLAGATLAEIGAHYALTSERVRQIEAAAVQKLGSRAGDRLRRIM